MRSEAEGVFDIPPIGRSTPYDCRYNAVIRVLINPFKDLETAGPGHFQIENQDVGKRMMNAVVIGRIAVEVLYRLGTVMNDVDRAFEAACFESTLQNKGVVRIILGYQDT